MEKLIYCLRKGSLPTGSMGFVTTTLTWWMHMPSARPWAIQELQISGQTHITLLMEHHILPDIME